MVIHLLWQIRTQNSTFQFFYLNSTNQLLLRLLALCLCLQYFDHDLLLLNEKSSFDPVSYTLGTHGTTISSADMLLGFWESHKNLGSHSTDTTQSTGADSACWLGCLASLLGIQVHNAVTRRTGQSGLVWSSVVGKPTSVSQALRHLDLKNNTFFYYACSRDVKACLE